MTLSGRTFSIVGVAPEDFRGINELYGADLWTPMAMYPQVYPAPAWVNQRRASVFSVIGRLKPSVGMAQAEGAMQSLAAELARQYPRENGGRSVKLAPVAEAALNAKDRAVYSRIGSILLVISGIVLLIACANVANLLIARAAGRAKEITVRIAIGASRWHLVRQLLVESVLLSAMGGAVGLLAAQFARGVLWPLRPPTMKYAAFRFDLDSRVLGYTFGIALVTGVIFGLLPAFGSRADLAASLKERSGSAPPSGGALAPALGIGDTATGFFAGSAARRGALRAKRTKRDLRSTPALTPPIWARSRSTWPVKATTKRAAANTGGASWSARPQSLAWNP